MTQSLITIRDHGDCKYGNLKGHIQGGWGRNTQRKQEDDTYSEKEPDVTRPEVHRATSLCDIGCNTRPQIKTDILDCGSVCIHILETRKCETRTVGLRNANWDCYCYAQHKLQGFAHRGNPKWTTWRMNLTFTFIMKWTLRFIMELCCAMSV